MHGGKAAAAAFDPAKRYCFGFVHHGLYPLGAGYLPFLPSFRAACPVWPVTLSASICVTAPLLRDIVLWLGVRVVSRRTFVHTLRERKAVLICPGGQAEMCLTNRLHRHKEFTIYAGHKVGQGQGRAGAGQGWAGLGRAGLGWAGLFWAGLGWAGQLPSFPAAGGAAVDWRGYEAEGTG